MGVGASLYMYDVVVKKFTFAISSPDEFLVTFGVRRSRGERYIGHGRLCVCLCLYACLTLAAFPHYCTDPDVTLGMVGAPLVEHYWADLQSVHGFRCYDNIAPNAKYQRVLDSLYAGFTFFFGSRTARTGRPILTTYTL